jgi:hypothetical protein
MPHSTVMSGKALGCEGRLLMKNLTWLALPVLLGVSSVAAGVPQCASGSTPRFIVENRCGDDVWMIETPPGAARAVQAQWDWFLKSYATVQNPLGNGGTVAALLIPKQASQTFCVPDKGAPGGNFRFYMGCPDSNPFSSAGCIVGSATGDLAAINTLFEPTFGCSPALSGPQCAFNPSADPDCAANPSNTTCPPIASGDNFDISAVDGYTIPMRVDATPLPGKTCSRLSTDGSMLDLASCPGETKDTLYSSNPTQQQRIAGGISLLTQSEDGTQLKACVAPHKWFETGSLGIPPNTDPSSGACNPITSSCFYSGAGCDKSNDSTLVASCPGGSGPQQKVGPKGDGTFAIQNTNWVQQLYALGYGGYTWQYGDGIGDQSCEWGAQIKVTLCPNGGVPYRKNQLWTFSVASGTCSTDGTTGNPDGNTTFPSLAACQMAKMRYTCHPVQDDIPAALWAADPTATLSLKGFTYAQVLAARRLVCGKYPRDILVGGQKRTLTLPECNYVYAMGDAVCPQ